MSNVAVVSFDKTLEVRDTCLCLHAHRAARVLARRFDEAFRPLGLTHGQFSLLISLNRPQPAGLVALAVLMGVDRTTVTAALKPLQRRGLVQVAADPGDRRGRLLALTTAGAELLAEATPIWDRTHAAVEAQLVASEPDGLRRGLRAVSG